MTKKEFKIGKLDRADVFVEIKLEQKDKGLILSITGYTYRPGARDWDCAGQIDDYLRENRSKIVFVGGWNIEKLDQLLAIWSRWHLNDLKAGCEHQRAKHWDQMPIDFSKPRHAYGKFFDGQKLASRNLLCWVTPKEHPQGLLTKPCPVCGYRYGTAWFMEQLPQDVIDWFNAL